jgi:hypothetical protein
MMERAGPLGPASLRCSLSVRQPEPIHSVYSSCVTEYTESSILHAVARLVHEDGFSRIPAAGPLAEVATDLGFLRERPTGIEPA